MGNVSPASPQAGASLGQTLQTVARLSSGGSESGDRLGNVSPACPQAGTSLGTDSANSSTAFPQAGTSQGQTRQTVPPPVLRREQVWEKPGPATGAIPNAANCNPVHMNGVDRGRDFSV